MGRTLPVRDGELIAWAQSLYTLCAEHKEEWGLNPVSLQKLDVLVREAAVAYENNLLPDTRNRISRVNKTTAVAALRSFLRLFVPVFRANEAVDERYLGVLGMPPRKRHARMPLPAPKEEPEINVLTKQDHEIRVHVSVPSYGHPVESATRKAYHGFVARYLKEGNTEWQDVYSTRLHTDIMFKDEDQGKRVTIKAAWINPRLQHGPWSKDMNVLIN
jgi:hypothetical protein